jgi:hypothetical protein
MFRTTNSAARVSWLAIGIVVALEPSNGSVHLHVAVAVKVDDHDYEDDND